jgi:predicted aspartyl protease
VTASARLFLLWIAACAAACATPAYGPRRTELPPDGVELPCERWRGVFVLHAELPGLSQPQALLLDTGTDRTLLDNRLAHRLGLLRTGDESVVTATGTAVPAQRLERLSSMRLGGASFHDVDVVGLDLSALRRYGGLPIAGIAGCDLFRQCTLEIDWPAQRVRVLPRSEPPAEGGHAFPERCPWITADVAGTELRLLVDTGFEQRLALPPGIDLPWRSPPLADGEIATIDGMSAKESARLSGELRIGELAWRDPTAVLVPGSPKIGARLLRSCIVRLDAGRGRIWIERK